MSLTQRRMRPLKRDDTKLRDDRLFIIACDDTYAPKQYFDFYQIPRVHVQVVPTDNGASAACHVLSRLLEFKDKIQSEEDDEHWLLLDADHNLTGAHRSGFMDAINEARQRKIKTAISKPCFELWLLLHHVPEQDVVELANATATEALLRSVLGQYNKKALRAEDYPLSAVKEAIIRAERLDVQAGCGDIPEKNTSKIYLLWKALIASAPAAQVPAQLSDLLS